MENELLMSLGQYGAIGVALFITAKTFWDYVKKMDVKQEKREETSREDMQRMEDRYIAREEKYIQIIEKFGSEMVCVKQQLNDLNTKVDDIKKRIKKE